MSSKTNGYEVENSSLQYSGDNVLKNKDTSMVGVSDSTQRIYVEYHTNIIKQNNTLLKWLIFCFVGVLIMFFLIYTYSIITTKDVSDLTQNFMFIETLISILVGFIKYLENKQMEYYKTIDKKTRPRTDLQNDS